jgi:hypothetical protein
MNLLSLLHRDTGRALCVRPGTRASASGFFAWLRLPYCSSLSLPYRGTGRALCVRPGTRASASAALTQALLQSAQRLGPERISSAALARPSQVARALCPGTALELVVTRSASRTALSGVSQSAQRPRHAASAISAAPSGRRRAGHAANAAPAARPGLIRAAQPEASEGSEGSRALFARPRMHERLAHAWGTAERRKERMAQSRAAAKRSTQEHVA